MIPTCSTKVTISSDSDLNNELANVYKWYTLNVEKSNFVIFHPRQQKLQTNLQIFINEQPLKVESSIKYLGVFLDCNLNWNDHINFAESKIKEVLVFYLRET